MSHLHANQARQDLHESKRRKEPVRAASTANVTLTAPGATIDGVTMVSGDRMLLKDQTTGSQNGIYTWLGASSTATRATDASASTDFLAGDQVYVREGTANGGKRWTLTTSAAITLGTTALTYAPDASTGAFSGEVSGTDLVATGLTGSTAASRYVGATASGAPSTGAHLVGDFAIDQTGKLFICTSAGTPGTWIQSGSTATSYAPSGLTGATAASRYVGATASGAPASGTFAVGDLVVDQTGKLWICTSAGSPGTWTQVSGSSSSGSLSAAARLRRGSNQSITTATATPINWDTEDTDTDNQHYTSSANLTGTLAKTASSASIVGTSTLFTTELSVGQVISVPGTVAEVRVVTAIADDTHLTVNSTFANSASGQTAARVNSALAFRTAGFYWVDCGVLAASATWTIQLRLNGSTIIGEHIMTAAGTSAQVFAAQSFAQWDYVEAIVTQSSGSSVNVTADQRTYLASGVSGYAAPPYACIQDQKAQNTAGGTFTSGAWRTRTLNTIQSDAAGIASLASNQITLAAGTYRFSISAPGVFCGLHQTRLQNVTDATTALTGTSENNNATNTSNRSFIRGRIVITGTKAFEVQHQCQTTKATDGLGAAANFGTEVYTSVEIWREA